MPTRNPQNIFFGLLFSYGERQGIPLLHMERVQQFIFQQGDQPAPVLINEPALAPPLARQCGALQLRFTSPSQNRNEQKSGSLV
eukprot:COSAG01_NODE_2020_length_8634_cov_4.835735_7_plen_84_part_00